MGLSPEQMSHSFYYCLCIYLNQAIHIEKISRLSQSNRILCNVKYCNQVCSAIQYIQDSVKLIEYNLGYTVEAFEILP